jgi:hypothetical protein
MLWLVVDVLCSFSAASATLLDQLDHKVHVNVQPLAGAKPINAECTYAGQESEDHFSEGHSYPFSLGFCTHSDETEAPRAYIFANVSQTSTFSLGEKLTLELVQADLAPLKGKADWAEDKAYLIRAVIGPKASTKNWVEGKRVRHVASMIYKGNQTSRSILSVRALYSDATKSFCSKDRIKNNFRDEVEPALNEASYGALSWSDVDVLDVHMGLLGDPGSFIVGCHTQQETPRIDTKIIEAIGSDKFNSYDHIEYWLPEEAKCTWGGLGQVGGRLTWERGGNGCSEYLNYMTHIRIHELGHNFGLHHAATVSGDHLDQIVE